MVFFVRALACFCLVAPSSSTAIIQKGKLFLSAKSGGYSTNAICRQYNCINPVVPGLQDLRSLSETKWQCQGLGDSKKSMAFCGHAVRYDIGVPNPNATTKLEKVVLAQDAAATTAYFYHLSGMNLDAWKHSKPWESDDSCVRSIYKAVCHTFFPQAQPGCKAGEPTPYLRPCKSVCGNYVKEHARPI